VSGPRFEVPFSTFGRWSDDEAQRLNENFAAMTTHFTNTANVLDVIGTHGARFKLQTTELTVPYFAGGVPDATADIPGCNCVWASPPSPTMTTKTSVLVTGSARCIANVVAASSQLWIAWLWRGTTTASMGGIAALSWTLVAGNVFQNQPVNGANDVSISVSWAGELEHIPGPDTAFHGLKLGVSKSTNSGTIIVPAGSSSLSVFVSGDARLSES
jgi:hypothetical protein